MTRVAAALITALALASCQKAAPKTYTVTMAQLAFGPTPAAAHVGDTIQWTNADIVQHTATARDGSFDVDLPPGASAKTVLKKAGTIDFYCRYHPGMIGRLNVQP